MAWKPSINFNYSNNNNSGYLSGDPKDYLYMDIDEAKSGNKKWLTYDEMRKEASGIKYDCFTDETCYGYNWDYDMEHYIPAPKEYANAEFYNDDMGIIDFYTMFAHEASYGDYPDFEDDEWWDYDNEIVKEGEDQYHYIDNIIETKEFRDALYDVLVNDDELADECEGSSYSYEEICDMVADDLCSGEYLILLRSNVVAPGYRIKVNNDYYIVDGDLVWDFARSFCEE